MLDPAVYDLGASVLTLKSNVTLRGAGASTVILSHVATGSAVVVKDVSATFIDLEIQCDAAAPICVEVTADLSSGEALILDNAGVNRTTDADGTALADAGTVVLQNYSIISAGNSVGVQTALACTNGNLFATSSRVEARSNVSATGLLSDGCNTLRFEGGFIYGNFNSGSAVGTAVGLSQVTEGSVTITNSTVRGDSRALRLNGDSGASIVADGLQIQGEIEVVAGLVAAANPIWITNSRVRIGNLGQWLSLGGSSSKLTIAGCRVSSGTSCDSAGTLKILDSYFDDGVALTCTVAR